MSGARPWGVEDDEYDYSRESDPILVAHLGAVLYARIKWRDSHGYYYWMQVGRRRSRGYSGHSRVEEEGTTWLSGWYHSKARVQALIAGAAL